MDIRNSDVKLSEGERLTDVVDGGGRVTGNEAIDGNVNNLFQDISRIDRTWESTGELLPARKTKGGTRYYDVPKPCARVESDGVAQTGSPRRGRPDGVAQTRFVVHPC